MPVGVKICGIMDEAALSASIAGGADFVGFVFTASKRRIQPEMAGVFCHRAPSSLGLVGLFVDPMDAEIETVLAQAKITHLQLHGKETPERALELKQKTGLQIIKAIPIASPSDLKIAAQYEEVVDYLLFDAKPSGVQAGGNGQCFDWNLLKGSYFKKPWFLAGGLTPDNIAQAVKQTGARLIDLSTGLETEGRKDLQKIRIVLDRAANL